MDPPPTSVNDPGLLFHIFYLVLDTHQLLQGIASIGRLICDISRVYLPNCLHFEVDSRLYYFVEYQIRVHLGECGGLLCFEVTCQAKELGNGEVKVDYFREAVKVS